MSTQANRRPDVEAARERIAKIKRDGERVREILADVKQRAARDHARLTARLERIQRSS